MLNTGGGFEGCLHGRLRDVLRQGGFGLSAALLALADKLDLLLLCLLLKKGLFQRLLLEKLLSIFKKFLLEHILPPLSFLRTPILNLPFRLPRCDEWQVVAVIPLVAALLHETGLEFEHRVPQGGVFELLHLLELVLADLRPVHLLHVTRIAAHFLFKLALLLGKVLFLQLLGILD